MFACIKYPSLHNYLPYAVHKFTLFPETIRKGNVFILYIHLLNFYATHIIIESNSGWLN